MKSCHKCDVDIKNVIDKGNKEGLKPFDPCAFCCDDFLKKMDEKK